MPIEIKDLIAWAATLVAVVAQFFHLKGRVALIEARQNDIRQDQRAMREEVRDDLVRINTKLDRISDKLDGKVDR